MGLSPLGVEVGPTAEELKELRRPFTPEAIRFKAQVTGDTDKAGKAWAITVAYIDARLVIERLNAVVGGEWIERYAGAGPGGTEWCTLTIRGQTHSDVGEGKGKGIVSDALKRAAVRFGIGVSVYATPRTLLRQADEHLKVTGRAEKKTVTITAEGDRVCRENYAQWLQDKGIAAFGEPFDHGDVVDSQGDTDAERVEEPRDENSEEVGAEFDAPKVPEAVRRLVQIANVAYTQVPEGARPLVAVHQQTLRAKIAEGTEALQGYIEELEQLGRGDG